VSNKRVIWHNVFAIGQAPFSFDNPNTASQDREL
jgi:hypothetical protein